MKKIKWQSGIFKPYHFECKWYDMDVDKYISKWESRNYGIKRVIKWILLFFALSILMGIIMEVLSELFT